MDGYAPATANRFLCALRGTLEEAWLLGQVSAEDYIGCPTCPRYMVKRSPQDANYLLWIRSLLQNCMDDPRPIGTRDAAVIAISILVGCVEKK